MEEIDVSSLNEPDPAWSFTDAAGHTHRWRGDWRGQRDPGRGVGMAHGDGDGGARLPQQKLVQKRPHGERFT